MMPMEIAPKIYDVGVTDWTVRDFHGYKTEGLDRKGFSRL